MLCLWSLHFLQLQRVWRNCDFWWSFHNFIRQYRSYYKQYKQNYLVLFIWLPFFSYYLQYTQYKFTHFMFALYFYTELNNSCNYYPWNISVTWCFLWANADTSISYFWREVWKFNISIFICWFYIKFNYSVYISLGCD